MKALVLAVLLASAAAQATASEWEYEESVDPMTSKSTLTASVKSDNSLDLGFPYQGRNVAWLTVRKRGGAAVEVAFQVTKGQLLCHTFSDCTIMVRFDDAQPMRFSGVPPADQSSNSVFFNNEAGFIAKAAKAKTIRVQMSIFQNGSPVLTFTPGPLDTAKLMKRPAKASGK